MIAHNNEPARTQIDELSEALNAVAVKFGGKVLVTEISEDEFHAFHEALPDATPSCCQSSERSCCQAGERQSRKNAETDRMAFWLARIFIWGTLVPAMLLAGCGMWWAVFWALEKLI